MSANARAAYMGNSVATASPATLLVMLCDRLVMDIKRGYEAIQAGDAPGAHEQFLHAQDIVMELQSSLKPDSFRGGAELAALYAYLHRQLVTANLRKDLTITRECHGLASQIAQTWRAAALQAASQPA